MLVDAHVHLFPPRVFEALWRWFDTYAWEVKYRLHSEQAVSFLVEHGVDRLVSLVYSHKPGMAATLNRYAAELASHHPQIIPLGTVLPGEPDADQIVAEALGPLGLRGLKLHCHVQALAIDDPRLEPVFRRAAAAAVPVVVHSGRAPACAGYSVDPGALCSVDATRRVLQRHPTLRLCVPHLGADEIAAHLALLDEFEHLYLDTTVALAGCFDGGPVLAPTLSRDAMGAVDLDAAQLLQSMEAHSDRFLYGTDFPNLPYDWNRELSWLGAQPLSAPARAAIFGGNALRLFT